MTMTTRAMYLLALALLLTAASAFTTVSSSFDRNMQTERTRRVASMKDDFEEDFPPEEGGTSDSEVDWDAEWKKVVTNQDQPKKRPGSDFYKSDIEIAAIKAANKAQKKIASVPKPSAPSMNWNSLQGDWKFWIGLLAIISIGTSLIASSGPQQVYTDDSFYI